MRLVRGAAKVLTGLCVISAMLLGCLGLVYISDLLLIFVGDKSAEYGAIALSAIIISLLCYIVGDAILSDKEECER
jgi:hypothetical protein